jgi:hypothetical protein
VWALVLATPVTVLIGDYLTGYVYYRTAATGLTASVSAPLVQPPGGVQVAPALAFAVLALAALAVAAVVTRRRSLI